MKKIPNARTIHAQTLRDIHIELQKMSQEAPKLFVRAKRIEILLLTLGHDLAPIKNPLK